MTFITQRTLLPGAALCALFSLAGCGGMAEQVRENTQAATSPLVKWPTPAGEQAVDTTIRVRDVFDGKMQRFYGVDDLGTNSQDENQGALFELDDGAVISNVIIGDPAADGIHCRGACTINNVWWEKVGEDAATFRGDAKDLVSTVNGGGASGALDKVFQHNGSGTLVIKNFYVEWFGKLYRSCGNCRVQPDRHVIVENVTAVAGPKSKTLVGINENFGDTAEFRGVNRVYDKIGKVKICLRYKGTTPGNEPKEIGSGPNGTSCKYTDASVEVKKAL
jgi:pectate lyase